MIDLELIPFIKDHKIDILSADASYCLNIHINLKLVKERCDYYNLNYLKDQDIIKHQFSIYLILSDIRYQIDIHNGGRLIIHNVKESNVVIGIIETIIYYFKWKFTDPLNKYRIQYSNIVCYKNDLYPINSNVLLPYKYIKSIQEDVKEKSVTGTYLRCRHINYRFYKSSHGRLKVFPDYIIITSPDLFNIITIYTHVYLTHTLPIILIILNLSPLSNFNYMPFDIIQYIITIMRNLG